MATYKNQYASIEQFGSKWSIYNDVTGEFVRDVATYPEAVTAMREIAQRYSAIEHGRNGY